MFLCGGAYSKKHRSLRDRIKPLLEKSTRIYYKIRVFYPEELMVDILNMDKTIDLLSCEKILADNSDLIVIICESAGSLVEFGAFVNNSDTVDKLIVGINQKNKKDKSFIMLGPVRYLENKDKKKVFYYSDNEKEDLLVIKRCIRSKGSNIIHSRMNQLNTIVGIHYFILILLYFYDYLLFDELANAVFSLSKELGLRTDYKNIIFKASINLLYSEHLIKKGMKDNYSYELTKEGELIVQKLISDCNKNRICDRIRLSILYDRYYKAPHS